MRVGAGSWLAALFILGLAALSPKPAFAEPRFPPLLEATLDVPCTPSCLACHQTDPGEATNFTKPLGVYLFANGVRESSTDESVIAALRQYAAAPANADAVAALRNGKELASGSNLCGGPTYGCGARVSAKAPPADPLPYAFLIGALAAAAVRRRRARVGH